MPRHPDPPEHHAHRLRRDLERLGGAALRGRDLPRLHAGGALHRLRHRARDAQPEARAQTEGGGDRGSVDRPGHRDDADLVLSPGVPDLLGARCDPVRSRDALRGRLDGCARRAGPGRVLPAGGDLPGRGRAAGLGGPVACRGPRRLRTAAGARPRRFHGSGHPGGSGLRRPVLRLRGRHQGLVRRPVARAGDRIRAARPLRPSARRGRLLRPDGARPGAQRPAGGVRDQRHDRLRTAPVRRIHVDERRPRRRPPGRGGGVRGFAADLDRLRLRTRPARVHPGRLLLLDGAEARRGSAGAPLPRPHRGRRGGGHGPRARVHAGGGRPCSGRRRRSGHWTPGFSRCCSSSPPSWARTGIA